MEHGNEKFFFQGDEKCDKLFGEIFLTTFGRIAFKCFLCNEIFSGFAGCLTHLNDHLSNLDYLEKSAEFEKSEFDHSFEIEEYQDEIRLKQEECEKDMMQDTNAYSCEVEIKPQDNRKETRTRKNFFAENDVKEHKFKCPLCGLAFKEKRIMKYHFERHTNERPNKCTECEKRFYTKLQVKRHIQSHSKDRNFLCSDCGKSYRTKSHLAEHAKRHTTQKDFHCSICDKAFYTAGLFVEHMRVHEDPVRCKICSKVFTRKTSLNMHMKLHENKREYKCELCNAEFNQAASLFSHMKTNHRGEK